MEERKEDLSSFNFSLTVKIRLEVLVKKMEAKLLQTILAIVFANRALRPGGKRNSNACLDLVFIGSHTYFFVDIIRKITAISRNTGLRFNSVKLVTAHLRLLESLVKNVRRLVQKFC